jgi:hypothetical protein
VRVQKLSEVSAEEMSKAKAEGWMPGAVMGEQRDTHRNAQDVHGVRRYAEIAHHHAKGDECNLGCEFWSPEAG